MYLRELIDRNFIEYASYVIKDRAIPHIDDGLKPVQRRILHSLWEMDDGKFNKVANVIGHAMKYHPHGDASIGDALVNLANREFFIDRQGNFGNIVTGDPASAARYIECRLTPLAREVLFNPDITETVDSYDGRNREPVTLPAKVPVLLTMGAEGIAVGLSTRILPHNFVELIQAEKEILKGGTVSLAPDFPQGGRIDVSEYEEGNGRVRVRATIEIRSPKQLVIREVPYSTTTESLIASIEDASKKGKIKIHQINDFTAESAEIEIVPGRGVTARELEPALYAFTDCEVSLSANLVLIDGDKPRQMTVPEVLARNVSKLKNDLEKELRIELERQAVAEHRKTLVQIFIENRVYKRIEEEKTAEGVRKTVLTGLEPFRKQIPRDITPEDVEMLLEIPIRRISRFDIDKNQKEIQEILKRMKEIRKDLKDMTGFTVKYLDSLIARYGKSFSRRTRIETFGVVEARKVDMSHVKVRYDENTGYLGTEVREGELMTLTPYDRILAIRKDGTYRVTAVPKKIFVGEKAPWVGLLDRKLVFNLIYKEKASGFSYVKRFQVEKFILDKDYALFGKPDSLQAFSTGKDFRIRVHYRKKPRLKVLEEEMDFSDLPVRSATARGNRVAPKEINRVKVFATGLRQQSLEDEGPDSSDEEGPMELSFDFGESEGNGNGKGKKK